MEITGARRKLGKITMQSTRLPKAEDYVATWRRKRDHCSQRPTRKDQRYGNGFSFSLFQKYISLLFEHSVPVVYTIKKMSLDFLIFFFSSFCILLIYMYFIALTVEGELLWLTKITRSEMGIYLCIASNQVPPSVSKRIKLQIHCKWK